MMLAGAMRGIHCILEPRRQLSLLRRAPLTARRRAVEQVRSSALRPRHLLPWAAGIYPRCQQSKHQMLLREHRGMGFASRSTHGLMIDSLDCMQLLRIEGQGAYSGLVNGSPTGPGISGEDETSVPPAHAAYFTPFPCHSSHFDSHGRRYPLGTGPYPNASACLVEVISLGV